MKKIVIGLVLLQTIVCESAYIARVGDIQFNLKNSQKVIIAPSSFTLLRKYSKTIDDAAAQVETTEAIKELTFESVDKEAFKFIVDSLKIMDSPGQLIIKLQNYLKAYGAEQFSYLMKIIQFFDIAPLLNAYESMPQLQQACPVNIKRKETETKSEQPKKLKSEPKAFNIEIPLDEGYRNQVLKIVNASQTLKSSFYSTLDITSIEELASKTQISLPGVSERQWYLLYALAKQIEDFSDDIQVHNALKSYVPEKLKEIIVIADYLEIPHLLNNALDLLFAQFTTQKTAVDAVLNFDQYLQFFNDISVNVKNIWKKKLLQSELLREFHWKGPIRLNANQLIVGLALSPNGQKVVVGLQEGIVNQKWVGPGSLLIDIGSKEKQSIATQPQKPYPIAPDILMFSPNGNFLLESARTFYQQSTYLINLGQQKLIELQKGSLYVYAFAHDNETLAYLPSSNEINFISLTTFDTKKFAFIPELKDAKKLSMAFSPNDQLLAVGLDDGQVWFFDRKYSEKINKLISKDQQPIAAMVFFDNKHIAARTRNNSLKIWNIEKQDTIMEFSLETPENLLWQTNGIFSGNGAKIAADFNSEIRIWNIPELGHYETIHLSQETWPGVRGVSTISNWMAFNWDGTRFAMSTQSEVLVWTTINDQLAKLSFEKVFQLALLKKYQTLSDELKAKIVFGETFQNSLKTLPFDIKVLIEQKYPKLIMGGK